MKPINLYLLSQVKDEHLFSQYENILSEREEEKQTKIHEQLSLCLLVNHLLLYGISLEALDGFFYSYTIQHISKEFDLLKFSDDCHKILNIELKSLPVKKADIRKQLLQNQHYLQHLSKQISSYAYVASSNILYRLQPDGTLLHCDFESFVKEMMDFGAFHSDRIDHLFDASDYLISPLNTPDKFLNHNYFLTNQQEDFKESILKNLEGPRDTPVFIGISGKAGTGKTLLLYDIAYTYAKTKPICIIHCGPLSQGHSYLASHIANLDILPITEIDHNRDLSKYQSVFIDEGQRIDPQQLERIQSAAKDLLLGCVYSYDPDQILSHQEFELDIASKISSMAHYSYKLSNRIRTNKELASFLTSFFDLRKRIHRYSYHCVDILYAAYFRDSLRFVDYYMRKGYLFFNFSSFFYPQDLLDIIHEESAILKVVGQEFEHVAILIDHSYFYNDKGVLTAANTSTYDYRLIKLLFQAVTRTREKLCIIVVEDSKLFEQILEIKK